MINQEKKKSLDAIYQRIQAAKKVAGRTDEVRLLAVSKHFTVRAIADFYELGQKAFGENYIQEWRGKKKALADKAIEWHLIGPVQKNKAKWVAESAAWLHSLDSISLAKRLAALRPDDLRPLQICIQINISAEKQKNGLLLSQKSELEDLIAFLQQDFHLQFRGVMCLPVAADKKEITDQMQATQNLYLSLKKSIPEIDTLSMGMSSDLEEAIYYGSTLVRVGTALFGRRV